MATIRVAIAGIGNCASALVQGIEYYRGRDAGAEAGLMHEEIGGWKPSDVEAVASFDIDRRKVGRPLEAASACFMKSPPRQMRDEAARRALAAFIADAGAGPRAGGELRAGDTAGTDEPR